MEDLGRVAKSFLWPEDNTFFSKCQPCVQFFKFCDKKAFFYFFDKKLVLNRFTLFQSRPVRPHFASLAFEAFSPEANIDKVVYLINLGLTKLTSALGRRPCSLFWPGLREAILGEKTASVWTLIILS